MRRHRQNVLYVTNERAGTLTMIDADAQQAVGTITLGKRPRGIVANADQTPRLCRVERIADRRTRRGRIETAAAGQRRGRHRRGGRIRAKLLRVLRAGSDPEGIALSRDGKRAFIANEDTGQVSVVQVADGSVSAVIQGGRGAGRHRRHAGRQAGVGDLRGRRRRVRDRPRLAGRSSSRSKSAPGRGRSRFSPTAREPTSRPKTRPRLQSSIPARCRRLKKISLGDGMRPMGTAMAADGKQLYVTTGRSKMVLIVDTATDQVVGSIEAGQRPWGIALSPDGKTLYTANGPSNDVSVIDLASRTVTKKIAGRRRPMGARVPETTAVIIRARRGSRSTTRSPSGGQRTRRAAAADSQLEEDPTMKRLQWWIVAIVSSACVLAGVARLVPSVTAQSRRRRTTVNWPLHNLDLAGTRFSTHGPDQPVQREDARRRGGCSSTASSTASATRRRRSSSTGRCT